ncbi:hypothetical protein [Ferrovibrio sp.]|uniref:hypothetical protein n=1 Tax=Ferrovibrio sp. TaxID=1917215 RepID=UPI00311E362B
MTRISLTRLSLAIVLLAGLGLAACSSKRVPLPACPRVGILGDAQKATQYRPGPGRDLTDVTFQTELLDYNGDCRYEEKVTVVVVRFMLQVAAARGPAAAADEAQVPYFVAIVDKERNILSRERFVARVPFREGRRRVVIGEELEQTIPLAGRRTSDIEILVGLELDHDQLEKNRRDRGF